MCDCTQYYVMCSKCHGRWVVEEKHVWEPAHGGNVVAAITRWSCKTPGCNGTLWVDLQHPIEPPA